MAVNLLSKPEKSGGILSGFHIGVAVASWVLTLSFLLLGCGITGGGGDTSPTVMGFVRDAKTGSPLQGATVRVGDVSVLSLGDGSFLLHRAKQGLQPLVVEKEGYRPFVGNAQIGGGVTVLPDIYLLPQGEEGEGTLSGAVVDPLAQGQGVLGAKLRLYDPQGSLAGEETSGYMGSFIFEAVPAGGPYIIEAGKPLPGGGRLVGRSGGIFVKAGETTSSVTVIVVEEGKGARIQGEVRASDGLPIQGATVTASLGGKFSVSVLSEEGGKFGIYPLPPGDWEVCASAAGFLSTHVSVSLAEGEEERVNFSLKPRGGVQALPSVGGLQATAYTYPRGAWRKKGLYRQALKWLGIRRAFPQFSSPPSIRGMPPGFFHEAVLSWGVSGELSRAEGFEVLRGLSPEALSLRARIPLTKAWLFSDLDVEFNAGTTYFYAVRAFAGEAFGSGAKAEVTFLPTVQPQHPPSEFEASLLSVFFRAKPIPLAEAYFVQTLRTHPASGVEEEVWTGGPYSAEEIKKGICYEGPLLPQGTSLYWLVVATDSPDPEEMRAVSLSEVRRLIVK